MEELKKDKVVLNWNIDDATQDGYLHTRSFPLSLGEEKEFFKIKKDKIPIIIIPSFSQEFAIVAISRNRYPGELNSISFSSKKRGILSDTTKSSLFLKDRKMVGFSYLYRDILNIIKGSGRKNITIREGIRIKFYSTNMPLAYILDVVDLGIDKWRKYRQPVDTISQLEEIKKEIRKKEEKKVKSLMNLSIDELKTKILKRESFISSKRELYSQVFGRNPYITTLALKRSKGKCELCQNNAPFLKPDGLFYLEVHHITSLSNGGEDSPNNVAALCPNCHRMLHYGIKKNNLSTKLAGKIKKDEKEQI